MDKHLLRIFLGKTCKKSPFLQSLYNKVCRKLNCKKFISDVNKRASYDIFNYEELIRPLPFCPLEEIKDSNYYGYVKAIKSYICDDKVKINIEHGLYLNDGVSYYANYKTFNSICTFSDYRLQILKKHNVKKAMLAIGPYIHYAESLLSFDTMQKLKDSLGRILLYMPSHSTNLFNGTSPFFKKEADIVEDLKIKYNYNTVIVCVYYRDFQYKECIEYYKNKGFKITTAGHQLDLNFAKRLKSIIMLSDMTVSNRVGTNLGFCIYLKKPHMIINDYQGKYDLSKQGGRVGKEISNAFAEFSVHITDNQYNIVNKYWGLDKIKSQEELRTFLQNNE